MGFCERIKYIKNLRLSLFRGEKAMVGGVLDFELQPITLKFIGRLSHFEEQFIEEFRQRSVILLRQGFVMGLIFYSLFGILDALVAGDARNSLWVIRFLIVDPMLVIIILSTYHPAFPRFSQVMVSLTLIIAGGGISAMLPIAPYPANETYYAGIILVMMLGYGFTRTRFLWASLSGWLNLLIYNLVDVFFLGAPAEILISNNFFFISANVIGMLSCYSIEYYSRRDFFMTRMLDIERGKVAQLNKNLESQVEQRTSEIQRTNEELKAEIAAHHQSENERQSLEKKLFQARKMESIGNLAGGIAHDFNNILSAIIGFTELSAEKLRTLLSGASKEDQDSVQECHEMVLKAGQRAADLVAQILAFARQSDKKLAPLKVKQVFEEVAKLLRASIPSTIEMRVRIESDGFIMGNSTELHRIIMNLCTNAAFAMRETGGTLSMEIEDRDAEVWIRIADTGEGIPKDVIGQIFEPYFTTKKAGEGTGLGLAVVHGIIESYGGTITVSSSEEGTEFILKLPLISSGTIARSQDSTQPLASKGSGKILFIDDEPTIVRFVEVALPRMGYEVICLNDGAKALLAFQKDPNYFDMVITDMIMPGITGAQLATELSLLRPEIPIILCSGNVSDIPNATHDLPNLRGILAKPFTRAELSSKIKEVLDC